MKTKCDNPAPTMAPQPATSLPWARHECEDGEQGEGPTGVHPGSHGPMVESNDIVSHPPAGEDGLTVDVATCFNGKDAAYIVAACNGYPAALAELATLRARLAALTAPVEVDVEAIEARAASVAKYHTERAAHGGAAWEFHARAETLLLADVPRALRAERAQRVATEEAAHASAERTVEAMRAQGEALDALAEARECVAGYMAERDAANARAVAAEERAGREERRVARMRYRITIVWHRASEKLEWSSACVKALLEAQERACADILGLRDERDAARREAEAQRERADGLDLELGGTLVALDRERAEVARLRALAETFDASDTAAAMRAVGESGQGDEARASFYAGLASAFREAAAALRAGDRIGS